MAKKTDNTTIKLIEEVQKRKAEIAKAEKPNWQTHCSFSYDGGGSKGINLHVEKDVGKLVCIAAFLRDKEKSYKETADILGIEAPPFTWSTFKVSDWLQDIKTRITKIQIFDKKKKLESLEARLNKIISPELRAKMELDAIAAELK